MDRRFSRNLLGWWHANGRDYPWRHTTDPYRIFISEILLHRTKADQVLPAYRAFLKRYPDISSLARASQADVGALLRPLGLRWRAILLSKAAVQIARDHQGVIPSDSEELRALPGVGSYISGALGCFAFGRPEVLLDTNTVRVLGRVFGEPVTEGSRRSKKFYSLGSRMLDREHPKEFNYAMIDLAAMICRLPSPRCSVCPVRSSCSYGQSRGRIE